MAVGAEYAAPYLGRMNDAGKDGLAQVSDMQNIVDKMGSQTRVLVASVRSADEVGLLAARWCGRERERGEREGREERDTNTNTDRDRDRARKKKRKRNARARAHTHIHTHSRSQ